MTYTDAQKAEAVRLYIEVGPDEAARIVGCSRRSIYGWLGLHGVQAKKPDEQRLETEARHTAKREALREALLDAALAGASAIDTSDPKGFQALSIGVGTFLDKYRLEMGESTSRTETLDASRVDLELARTVEEWRIQTNADSD